MAANNTSAYNCRTVTGDSTFRMVRVAGPAARASLITNIAVAALFGVVSASNASGDKWVNGLSSGAC